MKRKMVNSQISNYKTYLMVRRQLLSLAENVFEFENLPEFIDVAYLNEKLLLNGSVAFFKDDVMGVVALPYNIIGNKDIYGRPLKIQVKSSNNNYTRTLDHDEFVIMYDNNRGNPIYLDILQMAERIAMCMRTQDINIIHQRTPRIWLTSKDKELSVKNMVDEIDSMAENVIAYDSIDIDNLSVVHSPAPYITDKIDEHLEKLWAEFYRLIGVANLQEQKKERLIIDEMSASQGGTIASRFSRFQPRDYAIKLINKKFDTNIGVHYYDGEPSSEKGDEENVVSNDVSSTME